MILNLLDIEEILPYYAGVVVVDRVYVPFSRRIIPEHHWHWGTVCGGCNIRWNSQNTVEVVNRKNLSRQTISEIPIAHETSNYCKTNLQN